MTGQFGIYTRDCPSRISFAGASALARRGRMRPVTRSSAGWSTTPREVRRQLAHRRADAERFYVPQRERGRPSSSASIPSPATGAPATMCARTCASWSAPDGPSPTSRPAARAAQRDAPTEHGSAGPPSPSRPPVRRSNALALTRLLVTYYLVQAAAAARREVMAGALAMGSGR